MSISSIGNYFIPGVVLIVMIIAIIKKVNVVVERKDVIYNLDIEDIQLL